MELAERLTAEGAELIDVGGESGRTDRPAVPVDEEIARVVPLVERLAERGLTVSVDTWRAPVARAALAAGAAMVNDVSGLSEPELADACAASGAALVVTHTRAAPKQKAYPRLRRRGGRRGRRSWPSARPRRAGAAWPTSRSCSTPAWTWRRRRPSRCTVLRRLDEVRALGRPLLLALSRKDFIGVITERAAVRSGWPARSRRWAPWRTGAGRSCACTTWPRRATTSPCARRCAASAELSQELRLAEELRREPAA